MSNFVQFPEDIYVRAGNVFADFDEKAETLTIENARCLMWFAQLAYEVDNTGARATEDKIARIRTLWGFSSVKPFRERAARRGRIFNTTGLVGKRQGAVILAFAGTDPAAWETVATDARFVIGPKNTHEGFQAAFDAVAAHVTEAVELSKASGDPLFITGHSLGAALAIIAADTAVAATVVPRAVYGYGTPRLGGPAFQQRYNARLGRITYRLVHGRDIVARVPMFGEYLHVGRMLFCESNTKFDAGRISEAATDDPDFFQGLFDEALRFLRFKDFRSFVTSFLSQRPRTFEQAFKAVVDSLPQPGNGPLGKWFRLLPPQIREHLQDRYIEALTPGTIVLRDENEI
jgi:triacylglycerol lipase